MWQNTSILLVCFSRNATVFILYPMERNQASKPLSYTTEEKLCQEQRLTRFYFFDRNSFSQFTNFSEYGRLDDVPVIK